MGRIKSNCFMAWDCFLGVCPFRASFCSRSINVCGRHQAESGKQEKLLLSQGSHPCGSASQGWGWLTEHVPFSLQLLLYRFSLEAVKNPSTAGSPVSSLYPQSCTGIINHWGLSHVTPQHVQDLLIPGSRETKEYKFVCVLQLPP